MRRVAPRVLVVVLGLLPVAWRTVRGSGNVEAEECAVPPRGEQRLGTHLRR